MHRGMREGAPNRKKKRKAALKRRRILHAKYGADRISELPNDILISIISRLNVQEATATSILSCRWRYLHAYITRLDFPPYRQVWSECLFKHEDRRFHNHVKMINHVMDSHRSRGQVKELIMHMSKLDECNVEKWMKFAFTREIETIEIGLHYDFSPNWPPHSMGRHSLELSTLMLTKNSLPLPTVKILKELTLDGVDLTDQDFDLLVSNFLALEILCIRYMGDKLEKMSTVGHPRLRHVEVTFPLKLETFEIRDVSNLVSLYCYFLPPKCALELGNIPKFTKLYTNGLDFWTLRFDELVAYMPHCIRDQLQLLHLSASAPSCTLFHGGMLPKFVNVKCLELVEVNHFGVTAFVSWLQTLNEACQSLEKLKMEFVWSKLEQAEMIKTSFVLGERLRKAAAYYPIHKNKIFLHLKVVEICGYLGSASEFGLASCIINYATNLERVIVVACEHTKDKRVRLEALARAREDFRKITPPSIHLQIT